MIHSKRIHKLTKQIYQAPMEGVTDYIFRNTFHEFYGGIDKYFTPFICPHEIKGFTAKEKKEILPEHNAGLNVVPQLLGNNPDFFISYIIKLYNLGYDEVNFNLGCPSGTVVAKRRGSGFLGYPDELDRFFDAVFNGVAKQNPDVKLSVKTRLGLSNPDDIIGILDIYNKYPIYELTVHPRVRDDFYNGHVRLEQFEYVYNNALMPVVYNGDLCQISDICTIEEKYPNISATMIGRGLVGRPWLLSGADSESIDFAKFQEFHNTLMTRYSEILSGERPLLFRMKEFIAMWQKSFPEKEKLFKKILKTNHVSEYKAEVNKIFIE